jgi:hypothetical protein
MKEYLGQLSPLFGSKLVVKDGSMNNVEEGGYEIHKQLYKNGGEWHEIQGYEYSSKAYFIPAFTIAQGFLLVRMIPEFESIWKGDDEFPVKNKTVKKGEIEQDIKIEEEMIGDNPWIRKISIGYADGAIYNFEMYQLDNQLVVFFSSGV